VSLIDKKDKWLADRNEFLLGAYGRALSVQEQSSGKDPDRVGKSLVAPSDAAMQDATDRGRVSSEHQ